MITKHYSYDANENIFQLESDAYGQNREMDQFIYHYNTQPNNQLDHITDNAANDGAFDDITSQAPGNYRYDDIGNLIKDKSEKIQISWNLHNKVHRVKKYLDGSFDDAKLKEFIEFDYDAAGNRVAKKVFQPSAEPWFLLLKQATFYVRDASGNVMGIYELGQKSLPGGRRPLPDGRILLSEIPLYGSSRIGVYRPCGEVQILPDFGGPKTNSGKTLSEEFFGDLIKRGDIVIDDMSLAASRCVGCKQYELGDHLQSVRLTVSDRKLAEIDPVTQTITGYRADMLAYYHYYSGVGMVMPGRVYESINYRYGAQGSEVDQEIEGDRNTITTFYRPASLKRLQWWTTDPKPHPSWSPYAMFNRNGVWFNDLLGDTIKFASRAEETAYNEFKTGLQSTISSLESRLTGATRQGQIRRLTGELNRYKQVESELSQLESSPEIFRIRMGENVTSTKGGANFRFNPTTGEFDVNLSTGGDFSTTQKLAHELKHGFQYFEGKLGFSGTSGKPLPELADYQDEYEAYQRQNLFSTSRTYLDSYKIDEYIIRDYPHARTSVNRTLKNINQDYIKLWQRVNTEAIHRGLQPRYIYQGWQSDIPR